MARNVYRTVRCPNGCELWLHPSWLDRHLEGGRCPGHPWTDDVPDTAIVPHQHTKAIQDVLDASLIRRVKQPTNGVDPSDGRRHRPAPTLHGSICIESPIWGVTARRWLAVALAAEREHGAHGLTRALDPEHYGVLDAELLAKREHVTCAACGAFIPRRRLAQHRSASKLCHSIRAIREVNKAWANGWRDPWNTPGAPATWEQLNRHTAWSRRVRTVAFPQFIAVLLDPPDKRITRYPVCPTRKY